MVKPQLKRPLLWAGLLVGIAVVYGVSTSPIDVVYQGKPASQWVREAICVNDSTTSSNAAFVVTSVLREQAVPFISEELEKRCYSRFHHTLYRMQSGLPSLFHLLPEPQSTDGTVNAAATLILNMEQAGRPATRALASCLKQAPMHVWEFQEVLHTFIWLGSNATPALPILQSMEQDGIAHFRVTLALAIYTIEGTTRSLEAALGETLNNKNEFPFPSRELWWFREDEILLNAILPQVCRAATGTDLSVSERESIVNFLSEILVTNQVVSDTLYSLTRDSAPELREAAITALELLEHRTID